MDRPSARSRRCDGHPAAPLRAVIAVLALYTFVLQSFLGGLMPIPAAADGLCAQHAASDTNPAKPLPHAHGDCCSAAQATGNALPPRTAPAVLAWLPEGRDVRADQTASQPGSRAPPDPSASPRGPPSA